MAARPRRSVGHGGFCFIFPLAAGAAERRGGGRDRGDRAGGLHRWRVVLDGRGIVAGFRVRDGCVRGSVSVGVVGRSGGVARRGHLPGVRRGIGVRGAIRRRRGGGLRDAGPAGQGGDRGGRRRVELPVHRLHQHRLRRLHPLRVPRGFAGRGEAGHPGRGGGRAVHDRRAHAGDAAARGDGERAAAGHRGAELPVGRVFAQDDHVPADLPAEPDDADLPDLLLHRVRVGRGEAADDRRGAAGAGTNQ